MTLQVILCPQTRTHTLYYAFFRGRCKYLTSKLRLRWVVFIFWLLLFSLNLFPLAPFLRLARDSRSCKRFVFFLLLLCFSFGKLISKDYKSSEHFVIRQTKYSCVTYALLEGKRIRVFYFTFIRHLLPLLSLADSRLRSLQERNAVSECHVASANTWPLSLGTLCTRFFTPSDTCPNFAWDMNVYT